MSGGEAKIGIVNDLRSGLESRLEILLSMIFCGELMIMLHLWLKLRKLKVYLYCNFLIIAYNVIKILFEIAIVDL